MVGDGQQPHARAGREDNRRCSRGIEPEAGTGGRDARAMKQLERVLERVVPKSSV
jgi:hypothetical protein